MGKSIYGVYGAGGCGRGVMPIARECLSNLNEKNYDLVFVDDAVKTTELNGKTVLTFDEFLAHKAATKYIVLAIAQPALRKQLAAKCSSNGINFWTVISKQAVILDNVEIGDGAIICPFSVITSNVFIGSHVHLNLHSQVEHDCRVGNFVTFSPGAICNGNVHISDDVFLGSGSIIKNGSSKKPIVIGRGSIVGMGAIVLGSVEKNAIMVGNPARKVNRGK